MPKPKADGHVAKSVAGDAAHTAGKVMGAIHAAMVCMISDDMAGAGKALQLAADNQRKVEIALRYMEQGKIHEAEAALLNGGE